MTKNITWGWHLSVDASFCDKELMTDRENIYNFTKRLVKDIDMEAYGEPEIVYFGNGDKSGYTMQQLISTSNICAHFVDEYSSIFLDVFSCKDFDEIVVMDLMKEYFKSESVICKLNTRTCIA
jgi:S-adenosylmethionine/arginine decarboxylase-like enzyme